MTYAFGLTLIFAELLAASFIVWQTITRVNRMSRCTSLPIFAGWVILGGSAAAIIGDLLTGNPTANVNSATLTIGVAVVLYLDRRRK